MQKNFLREAWKDSDFSDELVREMVADLIIDANYALAEQELDLQTSDGLMDIHKP